VDAGDERMYKALIIEDRKTKQMMQKTMPTVMHLYCEESTHSKHMSAVFAVQCRSDSYPRYRLQTEFQLPTDENATAAMTIILARILAEFQ